MELSRGVIKTAPSIEVVHKIKLNQHDSIMAHYCSKNGYLYELYFEFYHYEYKCCDYLIAPKDLNEFIVFYAYMFCDNLILRTRFHSSAFFYRYVSNYCDEHGHSIELLVGNKITIKRLDDDYEYCVFQFGNHLTDIERIRFHFYLFFKEIIEVLHHSLLEILIREENE